MNGTAVQRSNLDRGRPLRVRDRGGYEALVELPAIRPLITGRKAIVLGSAPLLADLVVESVDALVCINGSLSTFTAWAPTVWLVNARTKPEVGWNKTRMFLSRQMEKQAAGRHVPTVVTLPVGQTPDDSAVTLERLRRQGTTWDRAIDCSRAVRERLCYTVGAFPKEGGWKLGTSAGLFGAVLAAWAGASAIELHGFSFVAGYAYLPPEQVPVNSRGHVRGDKAAIAALLKAGVKLTGDTVTRRFEGRTS